MQQVMIVTGGSQGIGEAVARLAALRGYAVALTYQSNQALAEALTTCVALTGKERWPRFLRWCLSEEESSVGAGAAILLYERGETRLNVIGSALLNALHDGV